MGYNPNIPQANDFISQTQKDILRNYQEINLQFGFDHVMITSADADRGKHKHVTFEEQSGDPTTIADEVAFYTKDVSGQPELYLAPESAATVVQATKSGQLIPGLRVEASVTFDSQGNIIEEPTDELNEEGEPIRRQLAFNVTSVVPGQPLINGINIHDDYIITFTNNISTVNYFWVVGWALGPTVPALFQTKPVVYHPRNSASYATSVTDGMLRLTGYQLNDSVTPKTSIGRTSRLNVIIYTVG